MADETHGIEIEIDSRPAESGKERVVRSLDDIKKKAEELGRAGEAAGNQTSDGLGRAATGGAKAGRTMDEIRAKARSAGSEGTKAGDSTSEAFRRAATGIDRTVAAAARLQPSFAQLEAAAARVGRADPFKGFGNSATGAISGVMNLKNALIGLGAVELGKYVINTEATFKGFDQALRIVTGSQSEASNEMAFAQSVAEKLGLRIKDLTGSYVGMLAAARGTNIEGDKSRQVFESVTKAGVAYGLSNDNIRGALLAVQQMMSKGTVQAEELRGQLGERLPGAFQVAARAMGTTTAGLGKMLEAGQVLSDDFLPKFAAQLNKEIPDGARSAYAGFNSFLDQLDRATRVFANSGVFDGLAAGAKGLGDVLQGLANDGSLAAFGSAIGGTIKFLGENIGLLQDAAIAYGVYFAAIKAGAVYAFVAELVALEVALGASSTATALFSVAAKGLQATLALLASPLVLVTAGVTGLVLAFMSISSAGQDAQNLLDKVGNQAKMAAKSLEIAGDRASQGAATIGSVGTESNGAVQGIDNFAGAVGRAASQLYELAKAKQAAALSTLIAQRNEAKSTYDQIQAKTDSGLNKSEQGATRKFLSAQGQGFRGIGTIVGAVGDVFSTGASRAAKNLGFGPSEQELQKGAGQAKASINAYDQAIKQTKSSLEQFVTTQDKAAVAASGATKPNRAMANALAQQAGATTELQKAQAGVAVVRAQASADLKAGTITQQEYTDRVGAAIKAVNDLKDATKGHSKALAEQKKGLAEAKRADAEGSRNAGTRQRITDRYDNQPRYLDSIDADQKKLDGMVGQWLEMGDAVVKYTQAMHDADSAQLQLAKSKPFDEMMQGMDNELAIQSKILQGRTVEAEALQQKVQYEQRYGAMLPDQYRNLLAHVAAQESITRALEDQQRVASMYVQTVHEIQDSFEKFLDSALTNPFKAALDFGKDMVKSLKNLAIRQVSEKLFGGLDREIADMVSGKAGVQAANQLLVDNTNSASAATSGLADTMVDAARLIRDAAQKTSDQITGNPAGAAANDNGEDIVVTGKRKPTASETNYRDQVIQKVVGRLGTGLEKLWNSLPKGMQNVLKNVGGTIESGLNKIGVTLPKGIQGISSTISKGLKGAGEGMLASGIVNSLGLKQSKTGAGIGGAIGSMIPMLGPFGGIIGGLVGGTIGGLFKKTAKSGATVTSAYGDVSGVSGTSGALKAAAKGSASSVQSGVQQVASQLGGLANGAFNVSIGTYKDSWRVNENGKALGGVKNSGAVDFGKDGQSAAIAYAIQVAVKQGAIQGITEASKRVLSGASNVDAAIAAATTYEDLVRQAAKLKDPIKGAFNEIKRNMDSVSAQLAGVGYSQAEIAQVQVVFAAQQKQALEDMTSGYKSFINDITKGPDSGMTIYDQFNTAKKDFATTKAGLADGTTTQDQFTAAGQKLFDLARQTYGTATPEFEAIKADLVNSTQDALKQVQQAASDNGVVVSAIQASADAAAAQRNQTNDYLAQIAAAMAANGGAAGYYAPDNNNGYPKGIQGNRMNY